MLIQSINSKMALQKLMIACICIGLVSACATSPSSKTSDGGPLTAKERLARIKSTGSSKDPVKDTENEKTKAQTDPSIEDTSTPEEDIQEPTPSKKKVKEEYYDVSKSSYSLPTAKKRQRVLPPVDKVFKKSYKSALKALDKGFEKKEFDDALQQFQSLETQNTALSGPSTNIGIIYLHQEKFEEAEKSLLKALEINNENEFAYNNLGLTYRELGKFPEAKKNYQEAIALNPKYAEAHYNLGVLAELYLQDIELAIQSFEHYKLAYRKKDQQVDTWLVDLRNRLQAQKQLQAKAAAEAANQSQATAQSTEQTAATTAESPENPQSETQETPAATEATPKEPTPESNLAPTAGSDTTNKPTPEAQGDK